MPPSLWYVPNSSKPCHLFPRELCPTGQGPRRGIPSSLRSLAHCFARSFVRGFFVYPRWIFWLPVDQTWGSWAAAGVF